MGERRGGGVHGVDAEPVTARAGSLLPPALDRLRRERGPFRSDDDLLIAAYYSAEQHAQLTAAGPIRTDYPMGRTPLVTLVKELATRPHIASVTLVKRARRAARPDAAWSIPTRVDIQRA